MDFRYNRFVCWGVALLGLWSGLGCYGCGGGSRETSEQTTGVDDRSSSDNEGVASAGQAQDSSAATGGCRTDADCVRGECCHPKSCVPANKAPHCEEIVCTMDCVPGTMDCGAGSCQCVQGECRVKWTVPPAGGLTPE